MGRRLRILSIASAYPYPAVGGTRILIFRQLAEMARHHDVDLVAVDCGRDEQFDRAGLPGCRSIEIVPIPEPERRFSRAEKLALTLRSRRPFFLYQRYSPEAQRRIDARCRARAYDVIIAEDNEAGLYVRAAHPGTKVLAKHSILSEQRLQLAAIASSPLRRTLDRVYARLLQLREREEATRFDLIKLPTGDDLERWRRITGDRAASAFVVSNGVDPSYFSYRPRPGRVDRLVFTANLAAAPNVDAARRLIDDIHPRVTADLGPIPLYVVGKSPPPDLIARAALTGATVTGAVPDVRPYFGEKAIAVVPLRVASGIINKVLEPMAMGIAVVASRAAVTGLEVPAEDVCLVADDAPGFARAVVRLARDEALYARLTAAAHRYVRTAHGWPALMAAYRGRVERAAGAGDAGRSGHDVDRDQRRSERA